MPFDAYPLLVLVCIFLAPQDSPVARPDPLEAEGFRVGAGWDSESEKNSDDDECASGAGQFSGDRFSLVDLRSPGC